MSQKSCLCGGRTDIRCDDEHCDLAGPGKPGDPNECRVCWLRLNEPQSPPRPSAPADRSSPCLYLGEVVDKLGCSCPAKWIRVCAIHKVCNIHQCKTCPDYDAT